MGPEKQNSWFERNAKKAIALAILLILMVSIYGMEIFLAYRNHGIGFNFALPNRAIVLREFNPTLREYNYPTKEDEPYETVKKKGYLLKVDNNGFIMPSERYSNPDISMVFLGDSVTAELYVEEENRFPYAAAVLLENDLGIKINSYNASRIANNTLHSINILLNKIIPLKPDIVIMSHTNNDVAIMLYERSYWNNSSTRSIIFDVNNYAVNNFFKIMRDKFIPNLAREIRLAGIRLRNLSKPSGTPEIDEFAKMRGKKTDYDANEMVKQYEMNLQTFIAICKIRKIVPVLMTMASRFKDQPDKPVLDRFKTVIVSYQEYKHLFELFNEALRKVARENNILLIDLAATIPPEKEYIYDIIHYNDKGSIKAAEVIKDNLKPLLQQVLSQKQRQLSQAKIAQ
jgi:lysophospholipase L1-like esterase